MNAEFTIVLADPHKDGTDGLAKLEVDLPSAPTLEMEYSHRIWHEPRKPTSVVYDVEDATYYVRFGCHEIDRADAPRVVEAYRSTGWTVIA